MIPLLPLVLPSLLDLPFSSPPPSNLHLPPSSSPLSSFTSTSLPYSPPSTPPCSFWQYNLQNQILNLLVIKQVINDPHLEHKVTAGAVEVLIRGNIVPHVVPRLPATKQRKPARRRKSLQTYIQYLSKSSKQASTELQTVKTFDRTCMYRYICHTVTAWAGWRMVWYIPIPVVGRHCSYDILTPLN